MPRTSTSIRLFPAATIWRMLLAVLLLLSPVVGWGQTIIALQDFEATPATPTASVSFSGTGGGFRTGNGFAPNAPVFVSGVRGYGSNNGTAVIQSSADIDIRNFSDVFLEFRLASFSLTTAMNGADAGDIVTLAISTDGGASYSNEITVNGNSNARWSTLR